MFGTLRRAVLFSLRHPDGGTKDHRAFRSLLALRAAGANQRTAGGTTRSHPPTGQGGATAGSNQRSQAGSRRFCRRRSIRGRRTGGVAANQKLHLTAAALRETGFHASPAAASGKLERYPTNLFATGT